VEAILAVGHNDAIAHRVYGDDAVWNVLQSTTSHRASTSTR